MRSVYGFNRRVAIVLSLCILMPSLVVVCFAGGVQTRDIYARFNDNVQQVFELVNVNARERIIDISQKVRFILSYSEINNVLMENKTVRITPEVLENNREINNVIDALLVENDAIGLNIYTTNKNAAYLTQVDYVDESVYAHLPEDHEGIWELKNSGNGQQLCYLRKYRVMPQYYNVIEITIPFRDIVYVFDKTAYENTYIEIDGMIFADKSESYSEIEEIKGYFYKAKGNINPFDIEMTVYVDKTHIIREVTKLWLWMVLIFILLIMAVFMVSNVIANNIMKGITDIVNGIRLNNMEIIKKSRYKSRETDIIKDYLIELQKKLIEENENKLKFESDMLTERISPHFLYNNLSALKSRMTDETSMLAIDRLVHYYRNVFQKGSQITTVQKEIDNGIEYLQLIQFSYESEFKIVAEIDEECKEMKIPSNILQPVLENAFIHGINNMAEEDGAIFIKSYMVDSDLFISVTDTGGKFDLDRYNAKTSKSNERHAMSMIAKRMKLYYTDDKYTITIKGGKNSTEVLLRFGTIK